MTKYIHIEKGMEDWLTPDLPNNYIDIELGNKDIFTLDQVAIPGYGNYCPGDKYFSTENFFSELKTEEARSLARSNLDISWKNLLGEVESTPELKDFILDQLTWNNIHGDTTITESLVGDELIIVNQDDENKAVKTSTLIKGAKEIIEISIGEDDTFPKIKVKDYINKIPVVTQSNKGVYITKTHTFIEGDYEGLLCKDIFVLEYSDTTTYVKITYRPDNVDEDILIELKQDNLYIYPFNPQGDGTKFLSDDGTYKEVISGIQEIPKATSSVLGGIKIGFNNQGKNYKVQLDNNGNAYVNVPWEDTTYTNATQTTDGLMSKEDKTKLDGLTGAYIQIVTLATYEAMYAAGTLDENTVYHIKG